MPRPAAACQREKEKRRKTFANCRNCAGTTTYRPRPNVGQYGRELVLHVEMDTDRAAKLAINNGEKVYKLHALRTLLTIHPVLSTGSFVGCSQRSRLCCAHTPLHRYHFAEPRASFSCSSAWSCCHQSRLIGMANKTQLIGAANKTRRRRSTLVS